MRAHPAGPAGRKCEVRALRARFNRAGRAGGPGGGPGDSTGGCQPQWLNQQRLAGSGPVSLAWRRGGTPGAATGPTGGPLAGRPRIRHIGRQAARQRLPAPLLCAGAKPGGRDGGGQAPLPCYDTFLVLPALLKAPSGTFIASPALLWCSLVSAQQPSSAACTDPVGTGSDSHPIPLSSGPTCATSAWHRIGPATSSGPHIGRNR